MKILKTYFLDGSSLPQNCVPVAHCLSYNPIYTPLPPTTTCISFLGKKDSLSLLFLFKIHLRYTHSVFYQTTPYTRAADSRGLYICLVILFFFFFYLCFWACPIFNINKYKFIRRWTFSHKINNKIFILIRSIHKMG